MKKISKADQKIKAEFVENLRKRHDAICAEIADYNETLKDALEFVNDRASEIEEYINEKSERWQDSENGARYTQWLDEWQNWQPEEIEEPENTAEELENLPNEPEG